MIGIDTGFLVELLKGNKKPIEIWNTILDGEDSVVSCISLYELKRLGLKGSIDRNSVDTTIEAVKNICNIAWINNSDVLTTAANLSHGLGLHMSDALILSGFIEYNATAIYTVDPHFYSYKKKGVNIFLINSESSLS